MGQTLKIIPATLLEEYCLHVPQDLESNFHALKDAEISTSAFSFYTSVASVFSSKIEGEDIELDSYIKHKKLGAGFSPDYTRKIDDLYNAYLFAQSHPLTPQNISIAHQLLSKNIVAEHLQGKWRKQNMFVTTATGKIEYVAALPHEVPLEMENFYADMETLLQQQLTLQEVFFFAALLHLVFVKIHPWIDGNGRSARLIEKWFLAQQLGPKAWFIESEKNYYQQHDAYYATIRLLGLEYPELDYSKALPFLLLLPHSF